MGETSGQGEVDDPAAQGSADTDGVDVRTAAVGEDAKIISPEGNNSPELQPTTQPRSGPDPDLLAYLDGVGLPSVSSDEELRLAKGEREATQQVINARRADTEAATSLHRLEGVNESNVVNEENTEVRPTILDDAVRFLDKVKDRFRDKPEAYDEFLKIFRVFRDGQTPIKELYAQISSLLDSDPDLLEGFKRFLPESASQTKQNTRPNNNGIPCENVLIYGHCRYKDQGCKFNHGDGTDSVSQATRPPAALSMGSTSFEEKEDTPDRKTKRASGVYVNGRKVSDLDRRGRRPLTEFKTPWRSFKNTPGGSSSSQMPPPPGKTFDNQGSAVSAPQAWYAAVTRDHLGSSSVPMAFGARSTENYRQHDALPPSYPYPDDAFEADVEDDLPRPKNPRRKTRTPGIYVDGKRVVDLNRKNTPVGSHGADIIIVDDPKEREAAEAVERYKIAEGARIAKEKAEKEAKEEEYEKRLREDLTKSGLDAEEIDAIMMKEKAKKEAKKREAAEAAESYKRQELVRIAKEKLEKETREREAAEATERYKQAERERIAKEDPEKAARQRVAAEAVERYKIEERERVANEKAEKETKEGEYKKRLREDLARSGLDTAAIDAIMKRKSIVPRTLPQTWTIPHTAPNALPYDTVGPRPVVVEERPRVEIEIVDGPRSRRQRHASDVPSSTRDLKEESTHPRHSSDVARSARSLNDDYDEQRRQRRRERKRQKEAEERLFARINEANAEISSRPPPPTPIPVPRRWRQPPDEVLDPEVKEEGKRKRPSVEGFDHEAELAEAVRRLNDEEARWRGLRKEGKEKRPSIKVTNREAELVEAVRRLEAEQERYEEDIRSLSQKEEGKGKEKQPSAEFPKREELIEARRQLDFERERREDARRQPRREEEEEDELQRRRLMERVQPSRRVSVGPSSRRTRVLYDDGTYRWE